MVTQGKHTRINIILRPDCDSVRMTQIKKGYKEEAIELNSALLYLYIHMYNTYCSWVLLRPILYE